MVVNNSDVTNYNVTPSFNFIVGLITNTKTDGTKTGVKIAVLLKYLSNFWRSLEMPLIKCKAKHSLKWIENCVLATAAIGADTNASANDSDSATFRITDAKLHVQVVTLATEDSAKLAKQLSEVFKDLFIGENIRLLIIKL